MPVMKRKMAAQLVFSGSAQKVKLLFVTTIKYHMGPNFKQYKFSRYLWFALLLQNFVSAKILLPQIFCHAHSHSSIESCGKIKLASWFGC